MPSALELLDRHCLTAVNDWKNLGIEADCAAILLARVDGPGAAGVAEAEAVLACFEAAGATWPARSEDDAEADAMFAARRLAYPALERLGPVLTEDVCVPVGRVPEMLARVQAIGERHDVLIANIAHAATATSTRSSSRRPATRPRGCGRRPRSTRSSPRPSLCGGTVTGEHGSGCSSATARALSSRPPSSTCTAPSAGARPARHPQPGKVVA